MRMFIRNHLTVLIAFALPIVFIIVVAVSIYIPSRLISTDYDFVYSSCAAFENYYCDYNSRYYSVVDGKLTIAPIDSTLDFDGNGVPDVKEYSSSPRIFLHDTDKNESREITLDEAKSLTLSELLTSPDGVIVSSGYSGGSGLFFPFGGYSSYDVYLAKGKNKSILNLINYNNGDRYYSPNYFRFIGWVL